MRIIIVLGAICLVCAVRAAEWMVLDLTKPACAVGQVVYPDDAAFTEAERNAAVYKQEKVIFRRDQTHWVSDAVLTKAQVGILLPHTYGVAIRKRQDKLAAANDLGSAAFNDALKILNAKTILPFEGVPDGKSFRLRLPVVRESPVYGEDTTRPVNMDGRLELFVNHSMIASAVSCGLTLHHPVMQNIAVTHDGAWEGNACCYTTVFQDEGKARMYYRGSNLEGTTMENLRGTHGEFVCYAESTDGINWVKPNFGWVNFQGSTSNNILAFILPDGKIANLAAHNFTPFLDKNPACPAEQKYKAIASGRGGMVAFVSADGLRWHSLRPEPILTKGRFDSQNIVFWDTIKKCYVSYYRDFREQTRIVTRATSQDFLNWSDPVPIAFEPGTPLEHLYTNAIEPYPRDPHYYFGFPMRFNELANPTGHFMDGVSDGGFMASRDGEHFKRWREAFQRPGPMPSRWLNRNNMIAWGTLFTDSPFPGCPKEISLFSSESYSGIGPAKTRRMTIRQDGYVSIRAPGTGGTLTLRPMRFSKSATGSIRLIVNAATAAFGGIRCAILDADGHSYPGFALDDCRPLLGDGIDIPMEWRSGTDLSALAEKPIRLHFEIKDADLFSLRFLP